MAEALALTTNQKTALSQVIVELVGLAGAGKTTLSKALSQRDERIHISGDLKLRNAGHLSVFLSQLPSLLPILLARSQSGRWFTWDEVKTLVYLQAWPGVLRRTTSTHDRVILLDQGPIFKLATLHAFGPVRRNDPRFERWWHSMFEQWACTLDLVIWLNAPAEILVERINARNKSHDIKDKSNQEALHYLARYRISYEQILGKLTTNGGPALFEFDTSQASIEQIVDEVLVMFYRR